MTDETNTPIPFERVSALGPALAELAHTMSQVEDGATHLTCTEAESIEEVLRAAGYAAAADDFIAYHAYGDDDPGDSHHAQYHEATDTPLEDDGCDQHDPSDDEIERRKEES